MNMNTNMNTHWDQDAEEEMIGHWYGSNGPYGDSPSPSLASSDTSLSWAYQAALRPITVHQAELQAHRVLHQFPLCLHLCGQQDTRIPNIRIIIMLGAVLTLTSTLSTPPLTPQWGDLCHKCIIIIFIPFLHLRTCSIIINLCRSRRSPSVAPLPLCMTRTSCIPILIIIQHKSKSFAMTLSPPGIFINLVLTTRLFVSILVSLLEARSCSSIIYHQT